MVMMVVIVPIVMMMIMIMVVMVVIMIMMMVVMIVVVMVAIRAADMILMAVLEEMRIVFQRTLQVEGALVQHAGQIHGRSG